MRTALLELLVVFSVRDVALKKTALPGAGSLFAFLNEAQRIRISS